MDSIKDVVQSSIIQEFENIGGAIPLGHYMPHQAHIALSEPMSSTDKQGSSLGSFPNFFMKTYQKHAVYLNHISVRSN